MVKTSLVSALCSVAKDWDESITYKQLCQRIESFTGIEPGHMRLRFEFDDGSPSKMLETVNPDQQPFRQFSRVSRIIVEDLNANSVVNQLQSQGVSSNEHDTSFHLSDEEYARRNDSVLHWKMTNNYGRFDPKLRKLQESDRQLQKQQADKLQIGQRCRVKSEIQSERRGWLRFVGVIDEINDQDIWCGVEFDDPVGKNDGSIRGHYYFGPVKLNCGGFLKPLAVETGQGFLPVGNDDESDDEI